MKSTLSRVLKALAFLVLVTCSLLCLADDSKLTLVGVLDHPLIASIETPEAEFVDAAFNIQEKLTATLYAADMVKGSTSLAKRLRVLIGTLKEGRHAIVRNSISIRAYLQEFATQWKVAVLIHNDSIMIVEPYDVKRFEHQVAILPRNGN